MSTGGMVTFDGRQEHRSEVAVDKEGWRTRDAKERIKELVHAGVHFGHAPDQSHPAMEPFLFAERHGVTLIDLRRTLAGLEAAYSFVRDRTAGGGRLVFIGTADPGREVVAEHAQRCGMPHVDNADRSVSASGSLGSDNDHTLTGLDPTSDAVLLIGLATEENRRRAARQRGLPVIALVDTDADPGSVDFCIVGNDDSRASCGLVCQVMAEAVREGLAIIGRREAERPERAEAERAEAERVEVVSPSDSSGTAGDERIAEDYGPEASSGVTTTAPCPPPTEPPVNLRKERRMAKAAARRRRRDEQSGAPSPRTSPTEDGSSQSQSQPKRAPVAVQGVHRGTAGGALVEMEAPSESVARLADAPPEPAQADLVPVEITSQLLPAADPPPEVQRSRRRRRRRFRAIRVLTAVIAAGGLSLSFLPRLLTDQARVTVEVGASGEPSLVVDGGLLDIAALKQEAADLGQPDAIRWDSAGHYLLTVPVTVRPGGHLELVGVNLRLLSGAERFVALEARGGDLTIANATITSWDPATNGGDTEVDDGRAYVLARDGARMDITGSTVEMLGYDAYERYGVSWRTPGTGGRIHQSRFTGNFYAAYMASVEPMTITDSVFERSVLYGLDPHTNSRGFVITGNIFRDNGRHGAILAEGCTGARVSNNEAYGNREHGLVVFGSSDAALVEGNRVHDNGAAGISVNGSAGVVVRDNDVWANETGIVVHDQAEEATIEGNRVSGNRTDGILVSGEQSSASASGNRLDHNGRAGVWVTDGRVTVGPGNTMSDNEAGVRLADETPQVEIYENLLEENYRDGVSLGRVSGVSISGNRMVGNTAAFSVRTAGDAGPFVPANTLDDNRLGAERVREPEIG